VTAWFESLSPRGALRRHEPMARHCSWRAGGAAEFCFEPADRDDLISFLRAVPPELPLTWVGLGSNLLVRDGGLPGVVILTTRALGGIRQNDDCFTVEAGVPCAKLARQVALAGHAGAEWFVGIPGTVGGALAMNAGAFGGETWESVIQVETVDRTGTTHVRTPEAFQVSYRTVRGPQEEWFLACTLRFAPRTEPETALAEGRDMLARRNESQPTGVASCGSVFRNPPGDHAGRLIEAAGLKGVREGGCHVSLKHANFIINDRAASAADIERLILRVQEEVRARFGILLQPEVRILGRAAAAAVGDSP
jgi:UDP-N-acetylmuramate dehydrogenase